MPSRTSNDSIDGTFGQPSNDERRTAVLETLRSRETPVTVAELASNLVERDGTDEGTETAVHRVRMRLHHVDLPRLEDAGLVEYEPTLRIVSVRDESERPRLSS